MVLAFNGPLSIAPLLQKLPYDVQKDLAPVITTSSQPNVLAVNAQVPAKNVGELVAYAKANPHKLNYASVGPGSSSHLNGEFLKSLRRHRHRAHSVQWVAARRDVDRARRDAMLFAVMQPLQPQIQAGKLRALAVSSAKRFPLLPDLPTIAESYPAFESLAWNGVLVPGSNAEARRSPASMPRSMRS